MTPERAKALAIQRLQTIRDLLGDMEVELQTPYLGLERKPDWDHVYDQAESMSGTVAKLRTLAAMRKNP